MKIDCKFGMWSFWKKEGDKEWIKKVGKGFGIKKWIK